MKKKLKRNKRNRRKNNETFVFNYKDVKNMSEVEIYEIVEECVNSIETTDVDEVEIVVKDASNSTKPTVISKKCFKNTSKRGYKPSKSEAIIEIFKCVKDAIEEVEGIVEEPDNPLEYAIIVDEQEGNIEVLYDDVKDMTDSELEDYISEIVEEEDFDENIETSEVSVDVISDDGDSEIVSTVSCFKNKYNGKKITRRRFVFELCKAIKEGINTINKGIAEKQKTNVKSVKQDLEYTITRLIQIKNEEILVLYDLLNKVQSK
ncbi:MAG: hypothetical protein FWC41_02265 [Firmicutes bacterium]|nr:hypothetical protein [Bacillota bacterium]